MLDTEFLTQAHINAAEGLARFAGKEALYEKYLFKFLEDNHFELALEDYAAKDYEKLLTDIHPLKGIVGTLGMNTLFEATDALVRAIRAGQFDMLEALMEPFQAEFHIVYEALETLSRRQ